MYRRTTDQMFGKVLRDREAAERAQREDQADRVRRAAEAEARLDESLTRREILDAVEVIVSDYDASGTDAGTLLADAFRRLAEALR